MVKSEILNCNAKRSERVMLKALFLDMDDTLCDTQKANTEAKRLTAIRVEGLFEGAVNGIEFADAYVKGIYRNWTKEQEVKYLPLIGEVGESAFRNQLIVDLLSGQGVSEVTLDVAAGVKEKFDSERLEYFNFYPGIAEFLTEARTLFTLVVITNGPEHSQLPKLDAVNMSDFVDHIIVGGQEPEQKPARSIFEKALKLANCKAHETIHIGDNLAADIVGAYNSGITSMWIQHQQPLDAELGINPHHTVMHPSEIPSRLLEITKR